MWLWSFHSKQGKSEGFDSCYQPSNLTQIGFKSLIFRLCDLEIWWTTPKNNMAPLLYYIKLCVSFHIHQWIQTGVTVLKIPIWVISTISLAVWPCHLMYDLEKQYSTSSMLLQALRIISYPSLNSNWSYSPETPNLGQNRWFFLAVWPCNLTYDLGKQ